MYGKSNMETYITICKTESCVAQQTQTGALYQPRGIGWGGRWKGGLKGREYMYTSDHELLIAKFRLKLKKTGKTTRPFRYDLK